MKSTVSSTVNEESDDTEETTVNQWRSGPTVTHLVTEPVEWSTPAAVTVVSIVDHTNQESVCTALLVRELLKSFFPLSGPGHVLGPDENVPTNATLLLVISSNGCFQRPGFVHQLFQAERLGIGAIPIILGDVFHFPSEAFFHELRALSAHILSRTHRHADDLIALIKKLFEEIGIHVCPQDSQGVLEVCGCDNGTGVCGMLMAALAGQLRIVVDSSVTARGRRKGAWRVSCGILDAALNLTVKMARLQGAVRHTVLLRFGQPSTWFLIVLGSLIVFFFSLVLL